MSVPDVDGNERLALHCIAVDNYDPSPLPDYTVFNAVLEVTAGTLRREVRDD